MPPCPFPPLAPWHDPSRLREVDLPPRPITGTSHKLRLREMAAVMGAKGIPVYERSVEAGDGLLLLESLLSVPSGCGGPHGHELIFPSLAVLEP